jgi:hypothetical protein
MGYRTEHVWSQDEDRILMAHYQEHGPSWDEWESLLPGRSAQAIRMRASRLCLTRDIAPKGEAKRKRRGHPDIRHRAIGVDMAKDPKEGVVLRHMEQGMTMEEIDKRYHWVPGTTKRVVMARWDR